MMHLTMKHVSLMRDFFVSEGRTNGQTDKAILGVGLVKPVFCVVGNLDADNRQKDAE